MSWDGLRRGTMSHLPRKALRRRHCQTFAQRSAIGAACFPIRKAPRSQERHGDIEANTRACTDTDKPVSGFRAPHS